MKVIWGKNTYDMIWYDMIKNQFGKEQRHTLYSGLGPGPRPFDKADSEPSEKADFLPKFIVWDKNSFLANSRVLI